MLKNLRIEVDAHTHTVMSGHAWSTIAPPPLKRA